ncbi:helix-turn-helix transcriptional regulator [Mycobacterium sp.]|uniref:helix-turn-helix transcriptional regulator n=1 Tax=Mycobacterium sp. TaxID=1785 RepID=UPI00257A1502|nr:helix-turn-helix transcriptional regulator [Mycobacterium sp.]
MVETRRTAPPSEFATLFPVDDIVYVDLAWNRRTLSRLPQPQAATTEEYVALATIRSGSEVVNVDGEIHRLVTGDVILWNCQAKTLISVTSSLRKSAILVPIRILEHMSLKPYDRKSLEFFTDAPTAPLLRQLLNCLGEHPPLSPVYRRTRNALLEIVLGTIESSCDTTSTTMLPALRSAVSRWIDDHIFAMDLSPRTIAAAHAVSVRTLHRAFESEAQTLTQLIQLRKLERACDILSTPGQTVTAVSERLNFANPSHFSRLFTKHYRISPREYRAAAETHRQTDAEASSRYDLAGIVSRAV